MEPTHVGRWPANLIHDGSDEVLDLFPASKSGGAPSSRKAGSRRTDINCRAKGQAEVLGVEGSVGSAARFFYCAKASKADRDEGNIHPSVKPNALMRHLVRLVTPPGGTVLDPFSGSGSTGKAAAQEGFDFLGIELDRAYCEIAEARISKALCPSV